jgi:hypothetical protein
MINNWFKLKSVLTLNKSKNKNPSMKSCYFYFFLFIKNKKNENYANFCEVKNRLLFQKEKRLDWNKKGLYQ